MSQFFVDKSVVPGGAINTLSAQGGALTPPSGTNFDFSGTATGAILFSIAADGLMRAAVQVDNSTIQVNGSNQLSAVTSPGLTWSVIGASQSLVAGHGYFCTTGGALLLALPAVSAVGDTIEVALDGSTSFQITQPAAANQIRFGSLQTTLGLAGTITSTVQGDTLRIVCETANARWVVTPGSIGNLTVA